MPKRSAAHHVINAARKQLDMTEQDLWSAYQAYGGGGTQQDISAFLRGVTALDKEDVNCLALALNDRFTGEGRSASANQSGDAS